MAQFDYLDLPAEPWSERQWFFNPFGWQLLFFTGFAFMRGWIPAPPVSKTLIWAAALLPDVLSACRSGRGKCFCGSTPQRPIWRSEIRQGLARDERVPRQDRFGLFRYMHFLSLAYLGWVVPGEHGHRLIATGHSMGARIWQVPAEAGDHQGRAAIACSIRFSMAAARLIGVALDQTGRDVASVFVANMIGFAMIIGVAYLAAWFKSQPWKSKK